MGGVCVTSRRGDAWIWAAASVVSPSRRHHRYCLDLPPRFECTTTAAGPRPSRARACWFSQSSGSITKENHRNHPFQQTAFTSSCKHARGCLTVSPLIHGRIPNHHHVRQEFNEVLVRSLGTMRGGQHAQKQSQSTKVPGTHSNSKSDDHNDQDDDAIVWIRRFWSETNRRKQQVCLENAARLYCASNHETRKQLVEYLAVSCGEIDRDAILAAIEEYQNTVVNATAAAAAVTRAAQKLHGITTPKYQALLERICIMTQDPIPFFIQLRLDLQQHIRSAQVEDNHLLIFYHNLHRHLIHHVLPLCFSKSQLEVRRITVDESSTILTYLADREAVHPVASLPDFVRTRIQDPHKRVYALFHRLQPLPLVVLHTALQPTIPASLRELFEREDDNDNETMVVATFYSISNLQPGLEGIGLGERLLREAVRQLLREEQQQQTNVRVRTFTTLSPMPGFREWVEDNVAHDGNSRLLQCLDPADIQYLCTAWKCQPHDLLPHLLTSLQQVYDHHPERIGRLDDEFADPTETTLVGLRSLARLAAHYLMREKVQGNQPRNPVARFHVHNGAQVYRINLGADLSEAGWKRSFGVMVNYRYDMDILQENQEAYEADGTVSVHKNVSRLL